VGAVLWTGSNITDALHVYTSLLQQLKQPVVVHAQSWPQCAHLEGCKQVDDVFMVAGAVQADLPVDLVLVQLAYAAHQVALQHDHLTGALADGFVHCKSSTQQTQHTVYLAGQLHTN
jgi:hypothetical protein